MKTQLSLTQDAINYFNSFETLNAAWQVCTNGVWLAKLLLRLYDSQETLLLFNEIMAVKYYYPKTTEQEYINIVRKHFPTIKEARL